LCYGGSKLITKTVVASLIAGVLYTIIMGLYFKKKGISSSRKYVGGITFTIVLFVVFLTLKVF
jgi:hypothetical protein